VKFGSVCSGIEAASCAWHDLGWKAAWLSEIEPFPSAVLKHHYPDVPNFGDMTKFKEWDQNAAINVLVGGTPCQSFSVAGLRKGLDDPRGNLMLTYLAIANKYRPKWLVWENVPGVLSSNGGQDFASLLRGMGELGYGFAYRVLDAQYFGVAQRRRRVFVVGCLGDWRSAAAVLFESHSLSGNSAPSREKRQVTPTLTKECTRVNRTGHNEDGWYIASTLTRNGAGGQNLEAGKTYVSTISKGFASGKDPEVMATLCATDNEKWGCNQWVNEGKAILHPIAIAENTIGRQPQNGGNGDGFTVGGPMYTLNATGVHGVAQPMAVNISDGQPRLSDIAATLDCWSANGRGSSQQQAVLQSIPFGVNEKPDVGHCLRSNASKADKHESTTYIAQPIGTDCYNGSITGDIACTMGTPGSSVNASGPTVMQNMAVRRLTPVECERLQGFPDKYTNIPWRNKLESPDGPRYKALGNSMAVPVMRWIGSRIQQVEGI
jgi:DNA (cytosine-5)-methyltransferase 1